jgi:hypothetical protein
VNKLDGTGLLRKPPQMQPNPEKIWSTAQENLRALLNPEIYQLWFAPLRAVAMDANTFTL